MQNVSISITMIQGLCILFYGLNERKQLEIDSALAKGLVIFSIVTKPFIDSLVLYLTFDVSRYSINRLYN